MWMCSVLNVSPLNEDSDHCCMWLSPVNVIIHLYLVILKVFKKEKIFY